MKDANKLIADLRKARMALPEGPIDSQDGLIFMEKSLGEINHMLIAAKDDFPDEALKILREMREETQLRITEYLAKN